MSRPRTDAADYQAISLRFPKELYTYFQERAKQSRRSLNAELLLMIEECLKQEQVNVSELVHTR
jgi:hypothetical protein